MALSPTSSRGGGLPLTGGTLSGELIVDTAAGTGQALELQGSRTSQQDVFRIDYPHTAVVIDSDGVVSFSSDDGLGVSLAGQGTTSASLSITDARANSTTVVLGSTGGLTISRVGAGGTAQITLQDKDANLLFLAGDAASGGIATAPPVPATQAFVSGAAAQIVGRDVHTFTPVTFNPTAGAAATCVVAVGKTSGAASTLWTETEPAGIAFDGTIHGIQVYLPAAWYLKFTVTNATLGTTTYY